MDFTGFETLTLGGSYQAVSSQMGFVFRELRVWDSYRREYHESYMGYSPLQSDLSLLLMYYPLDEYTTTPNGWAYNSITQRYDLRLGLTILDSISITYEVNVGPPAITDLSLATPFLSQNLMTGNDRFSYEEERGNSYKYLILNGDASLTFSLPLKNWYNAAEGWGIEMWVRQMKLAE